MRRRMRDTTKAKLTHLEKKWNAKYTGHIETNKYYEKE